MKSELSFNTIKFLLIISCSKILVRSTTQQRSWNTPDSSLGPFKIRTSDCNKFNTGVASVLITQIPWMMNGRTPYLRSLYWGETCRWFCGHLCKKAEQTIKVARVTFKQPFLLFVICFAGSLIWIKGEFSLPLNARFFYSSHNQHNIASVRSCFKCIIYQPYCADDWAKEDMCPEDITLVTRSYAFVALIPPTTTTAAQARLLETSQTSSYFLSSACGISLTSFQTYSF